MTILTDMADKLTALSSGAAAARMEEDAMRVTEQVSHAIFQQWSGSKITAQEWMDLGKEESPPGLENSLEPRGHGMTGGQETD